MYKPGGKRPLKECLGENSNQLRHKRGRFDNIVLLREGQRGQNDSRYYEDNEPSQTPPRRILRAGGKRKRPIGLDERTVPQISPNQPIQKEADENDIINELTKEFKKARLRPVFFSISSFIEQTVDEVGFTMADEAETEVTIRLGSPRKAESPSIDGTDVNMNLTQFGRNKNDPIVNVGFACIENNITLQAHDEQGKNMDLMEVKTSPNLNSEGVEISG